PANATAPDGEALDPDEGPTVRDRGLRLRMWRFRPSGPHLPAAIGLALAALGLGTALGLRITTAGAQSAPTGATVAHVAVP
ncbi:MAG TPA: hypothetical protein VKZ18_20090, partial [Polyangia bacterium]|nr:hypothetical protein [Polyangia bacterium]